MGDNIYIFIENNCEQIPDTGYKSNRSTLKQADRGNRGGGMDAYVRSNINVSNLNVTRQVSGPLDNLWLSLKVSNVDNKIGFVYRPQNSTNLTESIGMLDKYLEKIKPTCDEIIVLGDFNVNLLQHSSAGELLLDTLDCYGLRQIVKNP
nr:unnamed protein product [Callosobruchus chinensis]